LHALMLDTETTFDQLVHTYARDDQQAENILGNRFYRNIAGALSGTQEYMAMEKLYELHDRSGFELIVVDTPPTRHALDFLDAPQRLTRFLDNRVFRLLMAPTRGVVRVGGVAAQALLRTISRVVGTEPVDDAITFFRAFEGMEEGFRERAGQVTALLASDETAFVLVTSPRRDAVEEAEYFAERLADGEFAVDALIVNRVHRRYCTDDPDVIRARGDALASRDGEAAVRLATHYANLADFEQIADREETELAGLEQRIGSGSVVHVPELGYDVYDFTALDAVGAHLMGADPTGTR
jgi:anion-transporting  ArsA/GET3 family ATPase